jgi:hypothetical protein
MIESNNCMEICGVVLSKRILSCGASALILALCVCSCAPRHAEVKSALPPLRVGDWADYDIVGGLKQKRTVVAIDDQSVSLLVETRTDQNILRSAVEKKPLDSFVPDSSKKSAARGLRSGEEDIAIAGRPFHCEVFESREGEFLVRTWWSRDAPLDGLVQIARGNDVILVLRAFGRAEK